MNTSTRSSRFSFVVLLSVVVLAAFSIFGVSSAVFAAGTGHKHPAHPYIGVEISSSGEAATIMRVMEASPAAKAGLQKGDVITAINDQKVTPATIGKTVTALEVGKEVKLAIMRNGKSMDVIVTLADEPVNTLWVNANADAVLIYRPATKDWEVNSIAADSALYKAGFRSGDLIKTFNGKAYASDAVGAFLAGLKKTDQLTVVVERSGKAQNVMATADLLLSLTNNPTVFYQDELQHSSPLEIDYLPLTAALAKDYGISVNQGVLVVNVTEAMQKAGIKLLDVITAVNSKQINEYSTLNNVLAQAKSGDKLTLEILRAGKTMNVAITLTASANANALNSTANMLAQFSLMHAFLKSL